MMKCWIEKEELLMADSNFENKMIDDFKKMLGSKVEFYQPTILYYEEIKINRKKKRERKNWILKSVKKRNYRTN